MFLFSTVRTKLARGMEDGHNAMTVNSDENKIVIICLDDDSLVQQTDREDDTDFVT